MNLYRVAASQGLPNAMNCLAILLEDGRGTDFSYNVFCFVIFLSCSVASYFMALTYA